MCEKNKGTTECDKSIVHVMSVLHNVKMVPSNVRKKKNKGTTECDKSTVTCDVGTTQCNDGTIICEKIREPPNVIKYSHM